MRRARYSSLAVACLVFGGALAACGGGGSSQEKAPDTSKVPTATLPATLPEPQIIGGGAVQPGGGKTYTIKSGDTLAGIAERLGVTLEDLRTANPGIDAGRLTVGDTILLPGGVDAPRPSTPAAATSVPAEAATPAPQPTNTPGPTNTPSSLGQTYTVQAGDIPETIAQKFGITVQELLAANPGIDPRGLQVGQVLIIPKPAAAATPTG